MAIPELRAEGYPNRFFFEIHGDRLSLHTYWLRLVSDTREPLITAETRHSFWELQYVLRGGITLCAGGDTRTLGEGELLLIPPETRHVITACTEGTEKLVFAFSMAVPEGMPVPDRCTPVTGSERLRYLCMALLAAGAPGDESVGATLEAFVLELLAVTGTPTLPTVPETAVTVKDSPGAALVRHMIDYMSDTVPPGELTVAALSRHFGVCTRQIGRLFRTYTGMTPKQWIDRRKLSVIRNLLTATALNDEDIAEVTGFSGATALERFFRAHEYTTLGQFRRDARR